MIYKDSWTGIWKAMQMETCLVSSTGFGVLGGDLLGSLVGDLKGD